MTFVKTSLFHKAGEGSGGGGGGDQHNLGWYATQSALETAYPTATDGDWAIVGSTDTVWVWDSDTTAWKDTDQKGQVTSVNGKTGVVTLSAEDVGATPQYDTMPVASSNCLGQIVQYTGATDADYINGYFYKCVASGSGSIVTPESSIPEELVTIDQETLVAKLESLKIEYPDKAEMLQDFITGTKQFCFEYLADEFGIWLGGYQNYVATNYVCAITGQQQSSLEDGLTVLENDYGITFDESIAPDLENQWALALDLDPDVSYSWTEVSMGGGSSYTAGTGIDITNGVISVTSPTLQNTAQSGKSAVAIGGASSQSTSGFYSVLIDSLNGSHQSTGTNSIAILGNSTGRNAINIGGTTSSGTQSMAIGDGASATANGAMQICLNYGSSVTNSDANTVKIANANGNYEMMSADGTIPAARHASLPATDGTYVLKLVISGGVPTLSWVAE